jgi:hypothetical protein
VSNGDEDYVRNHEMSACRDKVENKMLLLETQMMNKIDKLQDDMATVKAALNELLTRKEFEPYRLVIMGLIGGVLMAVLAGLMALVIGK